jgi:hypothetical protein
MGIRLGSRRSQRQSTQTDQDVGAEASQPSGSRLTQEPDHVIDLHDTGWADRLATSGRSADVREALRARRARQDAIRDLERLRTRHWSPERIIEEGRIDIDFWEHHEADPYAVLSLLPGATLEEAAAARRRIAQQCHPDRLAEGVDSDESMRRMIAANAAYDRLRRALRTV